MMSQSLKEQWEAIRTDFEKAFEELYVFQYNVPGINNTFSVRQIDDLVLTSGRLIACDPLGILYPWELEASRLDITFSPGRYPVFLSVVAPFEESDPMPACAMLRFSNQPVVAWKLGRCVDGSIFAYGVDSGTGSFMDVDTAQIWFQDSTFDGKMLKEMLSEQFSIEIAEPSPNKNLCLALLEENWTGIQVSDLTKANIVAFRSGLGDGVYSSWVGYDTLGNIVSVVTDFFVIDENLKD